MKITTLLPLANNTGQPLATETVNAIIESLAEQFSGCTTDGVVDGHSVDGGKPHRDQSLRIGIVCENNRLSEAQAAILRIGRELKQQTMYFEVRDYDGVQFLPVE
jgi:hypothetical protein